MGSDLVQPHEDSGEDVFGAWFHDECGLELGLCWSAFLCVVVVRMPGVSSGRSLSYTMHLNYMLNAALCLVSLEHMNRILSSCLSKLPKVLISRNPGSKRDAKFEQFGDILVGNV